MLNIQWHHIATVAIMLYNNTAHNGFYTTATIMQLAKNYFNVTIEIILIKAM